MSQKHRNLKERHWKGEKIGGGYFVFRRHSSSGRIEINPKLGLPFEHPNQASALLEAQRLATLCPGKRFCVAQVLDTIEATLPVPGEAAA